MEWLTRCLTVVVTSFALGQALSACNSPPAQPPAPQVWQLATLRAATLLDGEPARRCDLGGGNCHALEVTETFQAPALVETQRGGRATIQLTHHATLALDERTKVALESSRDRVVSLRSGRVTVRIEEDPTAPSEAQLVLKLADRSAVVDASSATVLALEAQRADRVTVTVVRGRLTLRDPNGDSSELFTGQSARVVSGHPIDRRKAYLGSLALGLPRSTTFRFACRLETAGQHRRTCARRSTRPRSIVGRAKSRPISLLSSLRQRLTSCCLSAPVILATRHAFRSTGQSRTTVPPPGRALERSERIGLRGREATRHAARRRTDAGVPAPGPCFRDRYQLQPERRVVRVPVGADLGSARAHGSGRALRGAGLRLRLRQLSHDRAVARPSERHRRRDELAATAASWRRFGHRRRARRSER